MKQKHCAHHVGLVAEHAPRLLLPLEGTLCTAGGGVDDVRVGVPRVDAAVVDHFRHPHMPEAIIILQNAAAPGRGRLPVIDLQPPITQTGSSH